MEPNYDFATKKICNNCKQKRPICLIILAKISINNSFFDLRNFYSGKTMKSLLVLKENHFYKETFCPDCATDFCKTSDTYAGIFPLLELEVSSNNKYMTELFNKMLGQQNISKYNLFETMYAILDRSKKYYDKEIRGIITRLNYEIIYARLKDKWISLFQDNSDKLFRRDIDEIVKIICALKKYGIWRCMYKPDPIMVTKLLDEVIIPSNIQKKDKVIEILKNIL